MCVGWRNIRSMEKGKKKLHFVAEWRAFRGLSLRELAQRMEYEPGEELLSHSSVRRIENNEQGLTPEILHALAHAFDCGPEDILLINPLINPEIIDLMAAVRKIRDLKDKSKIVQATKNVLAAA